MERYWFGLKPIFSAALFSRIMEDGGWANSVDLVNCDQIREIDGRGLKEMIATNGMTVIHTP